MSDIIAVFDTNILVKVALGRSPVVQAVRKAWQEQRFVLLASEATLAELTCVLCYPKIRQVAGMSEHEAKCFVAEVRAVATLTEDLYSVTRIERDPTDNLFLACALEGEADYLVSEDKHLREIKYYHGVQIIGLKQFHQLLLRRTVAPRLTVVRRLN